MKESFNFGDNGKIAKIEIVNAAGAKKVPIGKAKEEKEGENKTLLVMLQEGQKDITSGQQCIVSVDYHLYPVIADQVAEKNATASS